MSSGTDFCVGEALRAVNNLARADAIELCNLLLRRVLAREALSLGHYTRVANTVSLNYL